MHSVQEFNVGTEVHNPLFYFCVIQCRIILSFEMIYSGEDMYFRLFPDIAQIHVLEGIIWICGYTPANHNFNM